MYYIFFVLLLLLFMLIVSSAWKIMNKFKKIIADPNTDFIAFHIYDNKLLIRHKSKEVMISIDLNKNEAFMVINKDTVYSTVHYSKQIMDKFRSDCEYLSENAVTTTTLFEKIESQSTDDVQEEKKMPEILNIDSILDKIIKSGEESLTENEKNFLNNYNRGDN